MGGGGVATKPGEGEEEDEVDAKEEFGDDGGEIELLFTSTSFFGFGFKIKSIPNVSLGFEGTSCFIVRSIIIIQVTNIHNQISSSA